MQKEEETIKVEAELTQSSSSGILQNLTKANIALLSARVLNTGHQDGKLQSCPPPPPPPETHRIVKER